MTARPATALYFTSIVIREANHAVLGGLFYIQEMEPTVTRPMVCIEGNWSHFEDIPDVVYAAARKPPNQPGAKATLCMAGRRGLYREFVSGVSPVDSQIETRNAGYVLDLRFIGSSLYACGTQNMVHRQVDGQWIRVDKDTFSPIGDYVDRAMQSITGFAEDDIYGVGQSGAIWHWNGQVWKQLDSPTNYPLFCTLAASDGHVYVGGSNGLLFRGDRDSGWVDLTDHDVTRKVLYKMCEFDGKVYIAAETKLLSTDGGKLQEVSVPVSGNQAFSSLDSGYGQLWTVGDDCIIQFDGRTWRRHTCPDNI